MSAARKRIGNKVSYTLTIDEKKFTDLVVLSLEQLNNQNSEKQVKIHTKLEIKKMVLWYFAAIIREAILTGNAFVTRWGKIQVLEIPSTKGYEWDKAHNFKDWNIHFEHPHPTDVKVAEKYVNLAIGKAMKGKRYETAVINSADRLEKLMNTLDGNN